MRTKDNMLKIYDAMIVMQYLYSGHELTFNNGLAELTLTMNENFTVFCKNANFPDHEPYPHTDMMTLPYIVNVVEVLKETPPSKEFTDSFDSKWDEIKTVWASESVLNET